jgi:transposase
LVCCLGYGEAPRTRRSLGGHRATAAAGEAASEGWTATVPDRAALTGIVFVLKTGIQWEDLPAEMGCGSGMTCWRRLRDWQAAGVWARLHRVLLERLHGAGKLDWSR